MRVTTKMLTNNFQRNMNTSLSKFQKIQNQLASGKVVSKPSDNPFLATRIMDYNTEIARKEQFERNIQDVTEFMDVTDSVLGQVTDQLNRFKELTVKAANSTNTDDDLKIIASEFDELMQTMVDTLNTSFNDKYIFGGTATNDKPFELVNGTIQFNGNAEKTEIEIAKGVYVGKNISGLEVLGGVQGTDANGNTTTYNLFDSLGKISEALHNGDRDQLNQFMSHVDDHIDNVLQIRGKVGSVQNRMDIMLDKTREEILGLTELVSNAQDVDYAEKFIDYMSLQASYQATLQMSSKIIQPSLLDFLR